MMWTLFSRSSESIHTLQLKEELGGGGAKRGLEHSLSVDSSSGASGGDMYERCDLRFSLCCTP